MSEKATVFEFTSYEYQPQQQRVFFHYITKLENEKVLGWTETITLPKPAGDIPAKLLESLHLILGISYYKFHFAPIMRQPYQLTQQQTDFWNTVYKKGLGEYLYRNNLDPNKIATFITNNPTTNKQLEVRSQMLDVKYLVALGGGKDSIVAAELLKEAKQDITAFVVETGKSYPITESIIKILGVPSLKIRRELDPKVHDKHPYNGHIPISAIYAFLGQLAATLYDYNYVVVGNEHSSNFGNLKYNGLEINHQWSKSFEFETLFNEYIANLLGTGPKYFSLLRPLHEIRIVKLFSKYPKYFKAFSSCNRNFTSIGNDKLWCGKCPKCVFAFTLLSAYLPKKELLGIFGQNLYQREDLLSMFKDILGAGTAKPFDCVGTFEEAQTAFAMARQTFLPAKIHPEVFATAGENLIPDHLKFLGMERVSIMRLGQEGITAKQFLKKYYPKVKIITKNADITIKTPGVHKSQIPGPYTTPTNIFFSAVKGKNIIIGVTGSKGKSTTASLIYEILKAGRKKVQLLGNIGKPMMEALLKPIPKDQIFVIELSSFQLDDIKYSPDIAVVTNVFPEHMDFHGNLENYFGAKKNIIKFQGSKDYSVYHKKAESWFKGYQGTGATIGNEVFETNLLGDHNQSNINAAVAVTRILRVDEKIIAGTIKKFKGLPHRLQNIGTFKGITFYDDAISTTPDSTIEAIEALKNVDTIFLGGTDRGYDFSQLEKTLKKYTINNIVLFPDSGKNIIKNTPGLNILETKSMKEAVVFAYQYTTKGKICLLSCASPSYSLWKNFEEKGDQFKKMVIAQGKP